MRNRTARTHSPLAGEKCRGKRAQVGIRRRRGSGSRRCSHHSRMVSAPLRLVRLAARSPSQTGRRHFRHRSCPRNLRPCHTPAAVSSKSPFRAHRQGQVLPDHSKEVVPTSNSKLFTSTSAVNRVGAVPAQVRKDSPIAAAMLHEWAVLAGRGAPAAMPLSRCGGGEFATVHPRPASCSVGVEA